MASDKMGKVSEIITELMKVTKGEEDLALFFSVINVTERAFDGVAYSEGTTVHVINAVCHGISLMADDAEERGIDRIDFLTSLVATIGQFDSTHVLHRKKEDKTQSGPVGNA